MFVCNADEMDDPDGVVDQECFNKIPLDRAEGDDANSPIDPNYPGRYYVDPECRENETDQSKPEGAAGGYVIQARYQLPEGLTCDRCVLQMVYCELIIAKERRTIFKCHKSMYVPTYPRLGFA